MPFGSQARTPNFHLLSITYLRNKLPKSLGLIGFAGAPWTLACYMIEGKGSKDFINTRKALWSSHKWFMELIETLIIYIKHMFLLNTQCYIMF